MPTKQQLLDEAKRRGIRGYSRKNKSDLEMLIYGSVCSNDKERNIESKRCRKKYMSKNEKYAHASKKYASADPEIIYSQLPESISRYYENVNRKEAENLLRTTTSRVIVRPSSDRKYSYAVTYKVGDKIYNSAIEQRLDGYTFAEDYKGRETQPTIDKLLKFHGII